MVWASLFGGDGNDGVCMSPKAKEQAPPPKIADADDVHKSVEEAYECDYERDCTPLYRAIENALEEKDFEPIVKFLDTGYWSPSFFSDPITPADQAKTWVTRFDDVDPNKVKWSQLPLHLAIVCGAPPSIIGRLVRLYPQALRCTDDQHMLPLHLALRHGADDEIVAFLLMKFPDAVNAKGKNGRTAVECALRAKDKLRGKILEIFVEKTRGRRAHGVIQEHNALKAEIAAKDAEIEELRADFEGMSKGFEELRELKGATEQDLLVKIQEIEQSKADMEVAYEDKMDRLQSEKMLESIQFQKKLEAVMENNAEIERAEKQLRREEAELRGELEKMQSQISQSVSPEDVTALKREMDDLRAYRLERVRSATKENIDSLKEELHKSIHDTKATDGATKDELKNELKVLRKTVEKLEKSGISTQSTDEMHALRDEVDKLRRELKQRSEASKTKSELATLKKTMEAELKNSKGKTKEELDALRKAVAAASVSESENKTLSELGAVKQELEMMKKEMKNKELINRTKKDLDDFRDTVAAELEEASDSKTRVALTTLQKSADQLEYDLQQCNSGSQVIAVKNTIDDMKMEVKKKSSTTKIVAEAAHLKASAESCIKNSEGKTFDDLAAMKKALKALNEKELSTKSLDELNEIKLSLGDIRKDLKDMQAATQAMLDLHGIKKSIAVEIKGTHTKTEKEIAMMKIAIDAVNMDSAEAKELKKSLGAEIKQNNTMIAQELTECKQNLDELDVKKLDRKDYAAWDNVRSEIKEAKELLESKQSTKDTVKAELEMIRKTAEDKKRSEAQFISLREEMEQMKMDMEKKENEELAIKQQLEDIKKRETLKAKKKKGLKKFFHRNLNTTPRTIREGDEVSSPSPKVGTIAPPSMGDGKYSVAMDSSSEEEESLASDGLFSKTSVSVTEENEAPVVETVVSEESNASSRGKKSKKKKKAAASSTAKTPAKTETASDPKPPVPPKMTLTERMRKVQSMDPRIGSAKRSLSKLVQERNGDLELEKVATDDTAEDAVLSPKESAIAV